MAITQEQLEAHFGDIKQISTNLQELRNKYDDGYTKIENKTNEILTKFENEILNQVVTELKAENEALKNEVKNSKGFDFVQGAEPENSVSELGKTWLDTDNANVKVYVKNPALRFFSKDEPSFYAKLDDSFYNEKENKCFLFLSGYNGNAWREVSLDRFKATYRQQELPLDNLKVGQTCFKLNYLDLYYRENNSWVQISEKLQQVRFNQNTEPVEATEHVMLNDIWLNPDTSEYKIFTQKNENTKAWVKLDEAYLYAKFSGLNEPQTSETIAINMHDLWLNTDMNEFYIYAKFNGAYNWTKLDYFKTNASFKGEIMPDELKIGDIWYHHGADSFKNGVFKEYQAQSFKNIWLDKNGTCKYATYKNERLKAISEVKVNETQYRPLSDELYIAQINQSTSELEWKKLDFKPSAVKFDGGNEPKQVTTPFTKETNAIHSTEASAKPLADNTTKYNNNVVTTDTLDTYTNQSVYFYPKSESIDTPAHNDTREAYHFNEQGISQAKKDEVFSGLHNAWVASGEQKEALILFDTWKKDEVIYFYVKIHENASFIEVQKDLKAFKWLSYDNERLNAIEALISPNLSILEAIKSLIEINNLNQLTTKAYVDSEIAKLKAELQKS